MRDLTKKRILIVENEATVADICKVTLGRLGHQVYSVCSGELAIETILRERYDLAIIKALLPGMDGIETFEIIQQIHPNVLGVIVSGHTDTHMVIKAMNSGFSGVLQKPIDTRDLVSCVQRIIDVSLRKEENTRLKTLLPLYKLGERFLMANTIEQVYEELVDSIADEIGTPTVSLMLLDDNEEYLKIKAARGIDHEIMESVKIQSGEKISGWVLKNGKPIILNRSSQHHSPLSSLLKRKEITAAISFPLVRREKVIGIINISQTEGNIEYSQSDIELLSIISAQALMAIENMKFVQEKEKSIRMQALFEQFVSPEIAHLLVKSQKNLHDIGGVEEITVLFADIRNFTSLVQKLPLVQLREFLNAFFDIFSDVVFSRKGTLDKFMGDAVLVIFGEPIKLENSCKAAVDAALDIGDKFEILRKKWNEKHEIFREIGIGIGISNGNVFLGNVGSSKRLDFTVIGKDVNVAQRLASDTISGQILVTESVRKEVCEGFQVRQEKDRLLKGMENKMELYTIVGRS